MGSKFYCRMGIGAFAYVNINNQNGSIDYAGKDNHGKIFTTALTRKEWRKQYPYYFEKGELEKCEERPRQQTKTKQRKSRKKRLKHILKSS